MNLFYFKKDTTQEIVLNEQHIDLLILLCNLGFMNRYQLAMAWSIVFDYPTPLQTTLYRSGPAFILYS